MLFLKQFRDIVFADRACFQAIVETHLRTAGYKRKERLDQRGLRTDAREMDSAPIGRELGVPIGPSRRRIGVPGGVRRTFDRRFGHAGDRRVEPVLEPGDGDRESGRAFAAAQVHRARRRGGLASAIDVLYGARIYGFGIRVDASHQAAILDRYVNEVVARCGVNYGPAKFLLSPCHGVDMVMLMFVEYERVASGTDDDAAWEESAIASFS